MFVLLGFVVWIYVNGASGWKKREIPQIVKLLKMTLEWIYYFYWLVKTKQNDLFPVQEKENVFVLCQFSFLNKLTAEKEQFKHVTLLDVILNGLSPAAVNIRFRRDTLETLLYIQVIYLWRTFCCFKWIKTARVPSYSSCFAVINTKDPEMHNTWQSCQTDW